jgi:hypothetical protein
MDISKKSLGKFFLMAVAISVCSCVSVNIGGFKSEKSKEIKFNEPARPFRQIKSAVQDRTWRNDSNGNSISFLSECNDPNDPNLEQITDGIVAEIDEAQKIERSSVEFNQRPALHSIIDGNVDGIATRFELMVTKKNGCIYVLTYAAVSKDFAVNQKDYVSFVKGFVVP